MFKKFFGVMQRVGKALMLPVAILPAAGLLLGIGTMLTDKYFLQQFAFMDAEWVRSIAQVMAGAGDVIFANLPLLFAVGVAIGLAGGEGVAGLAAIVGYLVMNKTLGLATKVTLENVGESKAFATVLGIPTLSTGVFGGIIVGIVAASMYNRFHKLELPSYLGFFAGKRFVPIATAITSLFVGLLLCYVWPPIQHGLNTISYSMINSNLTLSAFIFGVIERALIPVGLHHIFYSPFWFEFGDYVTTAGKSVHGDLNIFFAQLKDGVNLTAGTFMTGKFPFMMFGLPAAALAMYHEAKPKHKKYVAGIMLSAALTTFLTGITEPLEFSFLFVAPLLFAIHCVLAGLSFMTMQLLNVKIGMTFSGGLIDYLLFGVFQNRTAWWNVILVGLVFAVVYYFGFRFAIRKFNLKTPGREHEDQDIPTEATTSNINDQLSFNILTALGGSRNIKHLDACITRLRVEVYDKNIVNKPNLKLLGAAGVLEVGNNIQAIFGTRSDTIKSQMERIIAVGNDEQIATHMTDTSDTIVSEQMDKVIDEKIVMPVNGELIKISEVPDPVFSQKMAGEGFAVVPHDGTIVSPVDGEVFNVFPSKHAIGIMSTGGKEVLVHIGVNTVKLKGQGFKVLVQEGENVYAGQPIMEIDLEYLKKHAQSLLSPIVFSNLPEGVTVSLMKTGVIKAGEKGIVRVQ